MHIQHSRNAQLPGEESRITGERHCFSTRLVHQAILFEARNQTRVVVAEKNRQRGAQTRFEEPELVRRGQEGCGIWWNAEMVLITVTGQVFSPYDAVSARKRLHTHRARPGPRFSHEGSFRDGPSPPDIVTDEIQSSYSILHTAMTNAPVSPLNRPLQILMYQYSQRPSVRKSAFVGEELPANHQGRSWCHRYRAAHLDRIDYSWMAGCGDSEHHEVTLQRVSNHDRLRSNQVIQCFTYPL